MKNAPEKPGDRLIKELQIRDWTQGDLAEVIDRPAQLISEVIHGKKEITRETAAQLGAALNTTPELWLRMEDAVHLVQQEQDPQLQRKLREIDIRAQEAIQRVKVRPRPPAYSVAWSPEIHKHVATVDAYPELSASAGSAEYALRKLRAMVAAAKRA
jgi:addiction module HigA family antidote